MRILEAFREHFPNAEEVHGHGPDSMMLEWDDLVYVATESEAGGFAVHLAIYDDFAWAAGLNPKIRCDVKDLKTAVRWVDYLTD